MDLDDVNLITDFLTKNVYPHNFTNNDKRSLRQKAKSFVCVADSEGITRLYHRGKNDRNQLVVCDPELKRNILLTAHIDVTGPGSGRPSTVAGGIPHNGINTTRRKISEFYWWRRLVEDVRSFCKECSGCCHVSATLTSVHNQSSLDDNEDAGNNEEISEPLPLVPPPPPPVEEKITRCDPSYSGQLLESLRMMCEQQVFTDAVVVSEDSLYHRAAHRVVLASASSYLKSLIINAVQPMYYIIVPDVSGSCLEDLVNFMYTGELHLTMSRVPELCSAAERLGMSAVVELCQKYLVNTTTEPCGSETEVEDDQSENILNHVEHRLEHAPIVEPASEDMSEQLIKKPSKERVIVNERFKTPRCSEIKSTKRKEYEESKSTPNIIPRRSKQRRVIVKTMLEAVACEEVNDDGDGNIGSSFEQEQEKSENYVHCRRNPARAKKAGRYVNPNTQMANPTQKEKRKTSKLSNRKKVDTMGSSSMRCKGAGLIKQSYKTIRYAALAAGRTRFHSWLRTQQLIYRAISLLSRHKASRTSSGHYACLSCFLNGPTFTTVSHFAAHCIRSHRKWTCSVCLRRFASLSARSRHRIIVHNYRILKQHHAVHPLHSSASNSSLLNELQTQFNSTVEHSSTHNKCGWCGEKFALRSELLVHRDTVHRRPKTSVEASDLKVRRRVIREWTCSEKGCGERFKVKDQLRDHMAISHSSVIFSCPECRFKTQVELFLRRHLLRRHRVQHCCHLCGKSYHKPFLLRVHLFYGHKITDPSLKIYTCSHEGCSFACPSKNGIDQHLLKHSQPNAFACSECGKTFKREAGLNKHLRKVHLGIRPYICDKCGVSCGDESELKLHLTRHIESKRYTCDHCPYSTFQRSSLKSHLFTRHNVRIDTDMAVLQCPTCQFVTDKRCRYSDHMKMHQNIRDIPCVQCGKLFVTKKTLRQHVNKVHRRGVTNPALQNATPAPQLLVCSLCSFNAPNAVEMNEHVRTMHVNSIITRLNVSNYMYEGAVTVDRQPSTADLSAITSVASHDHQHAVGLHCSTSMPTMDDVLMADSGTVKCHTMMLPATTSTGDFTTLQKLRPLDAMSMVTVNSIMVDINQLPIESTAVGFTNFPSFDVSNRLVGL